MENMQNFIGTKLIKAAPMTRAEYNVYRGWVLPADENGEDAGYLVEYLDGGQANHPDHVGYISWSPSAVFAQAYHDVRGALSFGDALIMLKSGAKLARAGWNGKGMFIYLVPAASYPVQTGAAKSHFGEGALVPYNAYFAIKNVDDTVSTWVPSINDALSEDWGIIP